MKVTTREIQLHQLDMLKQLMKVFEENEIDFFAVGGTALGAVRHAGFIPWDDDIDIAMTRDNYDRFLALQPSLPSNLFIQNFVTEPEYPLYFSKVRDLSTVFIDRELVDHKIQHGVFIDVFPWDAVIECSSEKELLMDAFRAFRRCLWTQHRSRNLVLLLKMLAFRVKYLITSGKRAYEKLDSMHQRNNDSVSSKLGHVLVDDVLERDDLFPLRYIEFEDIQLPCPNKIEAYLAGKYGNYMELPPVSQRHHHHPLQVVL